MVDKDAIRRAYDDLANTYAAQRSENDRGMDVLTEFLKSFSDPIRVLDAGCGQGTPVLSELSGSTEAVGIDISRKQLELATENVIDTSIVQGDITTLPFDSGTFDAVIAYWSLIHIPMDDHQTVIDEFARVLRPNGQVLLCEGRDEWLGENPDWLDSGVKMEWNIAGEKKTRNQLQDAGFVIEKRWGSSDTLDDKNSDKNGEDPWIFFSAQLDG